MRNFKLLALPLLLGALLLTGCGPTPKMPSFRSPTPYATPTMRLAIPPDWQVKETRSHDPLRHLSVVCDKTDAAVVFALRDMTDALPRELGKAATTVSHQFQKTRIFRKFDSWQHFTGAGAEMTGESADLRYRIRLFITDLGDGQLLEVREMWPDYAFAGPEIGDGVKTIRESFQLVGYMPPAPEAAPAEPTAPSAESSGQAGG